MPEHETRSLRHIYLPGHGDREAFTSPLSGGGGFELPVRDRARHAEALERALAEALGAADAQNCDTGCRNRRRYDGLLSRVRTALLADGAP